MTIWCDLIYFCVAVTELFRVSSPCQAASSQSAGMEKLQHLKDILVEEGRERVQQELQGIPRDVHARSLQSGAVAGGRADWTDFYGG